MYQVLRQSLMVAGELRIVHRRAYWYAGVSPESSHRAQRQLESENLVRGSDTYDPQREQLIHCKGDSNEYGGHGRVAAELQDAYSASK